MSQPIKSRIDFPVTQPVEPQAAGKTARTFSESESEKFIAELHPAETEEDASQGEELVIDALQPKPGLWRRLVTGGLLLFGLSVVAQGGQWIYRAWQAQEWIALSAASAGSLIVIAGIGAVAGEWRRLRRLRQRADERDVARDLLQSQGTGKGRDFCEKLARQAGLDSGHPALQRWQSALHETQNDREVVALYAQWVQPVLDEQARREIGRSAAASAMMIAVSPLALVDMAFIAWRNIRLVNRIAALYGIELGYFSRIRLFRMVLINIAFAGASEFVADAGLDWISQDITAKLSARLAQGLGAGLLTARLGIKAMELCRPLPWLENDKPRLGDFRRQLVVQLKETFSKTQARKKAAAENAADR